MIRANFVGEGDYVDVSSVNPANGFFDIENHTCDAEDGYTYDGKFIIASFAFQITGDGPIEFALQDPEGTIDHDLSGASYFAKKSEGLATENATTYAPNGENPGSMKMTFMGENTNKGGEVQPTTYTVTFLDKDGEEISSTEYEADADVTIPDLPEKTYDETNHYTYAWNAEPSAKATADATYQIVETATAHTFGDWEETEAAVPATCTTDGKTAVEKKTCTDCDYFETQGGTVVEAINHNYKVVSIDWTTLDTETGKVTASFVCENDNTHTKNDEVQTTFEITQAATEDLVELTTYTYEEGEFKDSTTVQTGEKAAHVHSYNEVVTPPTCTEQGYTTYTCKCGDSYTGNYENPLGHDLCDWFEFEAAIPATCTEAGKEAVEKRTCNREGCDYYETQGGAEIEALGHDYVWEEKEAAVPATCTTDGKTAVETGKCSRCPEETERGGETVEKLGHDITWKETTAAVPATCTTDGKTAIETASCSRCDYTDTRGGDKINAKGHTEVVDAAVAATCTEAGKTEGKHCSTCGTVFVAQTEIPATGHDWGDGVVTLEPTAMDKGIKTFTCQTCGVKRTEEIAAYKATKANPIKVTAVKKTPTAKASTLKKKNQTYALKKFVKVSKSKGKVTYNKTSGNKKITVDTKTGKITLKKGLKKGTYKVKMKVQDHGTKKFKAKAKTVTFKIKVK
jgi:methionine-rich copper-binding protein CopC